MFKVINKTVVLNLFAVNIYLLKVNNRNTRQRKTVNFEHTSYLFLVFLLLTLNK